LAQNALPSDFFAATDPTDLSHEAALAGAADQQGLLIFFETPVCPYCKRMRRDVLSRPEVQDYYQQQFRSLAVNSLSEAAIQTWDGQAISLAQFAADNRIRVTPTLVFYDLEGDMLHRHTGIIADPTEFILLGRYVAEAVYLEKAYPEFIRQQR
jgi:thioredoxin-related protein